MQLTTSGCPFIVRAIPQGHMVGGISLIWAIPNNYRHIGVDGPSIGLGGQYLAGVRAGVPRCVGNDRGDHTGQRYLHRDKRSARYLGADRASPAERYRVDGRQANRPRADRTQAASLDNLCRVLGVLRAGVIFFRLPLSAGGARTDHRGGDRLGSHARGWGRRSSGLKRMMSRWRQGDERAALGDS